MANLPTGPTDTHASLKTPKSSEKKPDFADARDAGPMASNLVGGDDRLGVERRGGGGYSRFVSLTKVFLPFFALGLVILVLVWPRLKTDNTFSIGFSSIQLSGEAQPGMDNARYVGTDENRQPYSVTADVARIISESKGQVALELPKADLTLDDGTWLVLTADTGRYDGQNATLELQGGVNMFHDTGYEISTEQLMVHLKQGKAESNTPLTGHGPFGALKAKGLKLIDKGQLIYFTGPAQLILYAPQDGGSPKE